MKRIIPFFLIIFFAAGVFAQGTITVTVTSSEAGSGLTEIEYELTGDAGTYDISVEVSFDNGANYTPIPEADLTGPLTDVNPGTHQLTWDGAASFPEIFSDETTIKITATWLTCGDITFNYRGQDVTYGTIVRGGLCWMDRNLGASQVPTASNDHLGYGDLFQWGRLDDGHQVVTWTSPTTGDVTPTTSILSPTDIPGHGDFIEAPNSPFDWRSPKNDYLWKEDGTGVNNPCPPGWRVPTEAELNAERLSWGSNNSAGAYASTLVWPVGGSRDFFGPLSGVGSSGNVWSSSVSGTNARGLRFTSSDAFMGIYFRAFGMSVRCVREP